MITVPCTWFVGVNKRKNYLNLNTYRNAHFIALNRSKKDYKEEIKEELRKLGVFKKVKPVYKYYLPRKCDIGNVHSILEKYFLDAFVELGHIQDDDCTQVIGADYEFVEYDKKNPRCEIFIEELI